MVDENIKMILRVMGEPIVAGGKNIPLSEAALRRLAELGITQKKERSLHKIIELHAKAAAIAHEQRLSIFNGIVDHKELWGPRFKAAEEAGLPVPNILPHPDDLVLDADGNCDARFVAFDEKKKGEQKILVEHLNAISLVLSSFIGREFPDDMAQSLSRERKRLMKEFRKFNSILPPRLQVAMPMKHWKDLPEESAIPVNEIPLVSDRFSPWITPNDEDAIGELNELQNNDDSGESLDEKQAGVAFPETEVVTANQPDEIAIHETPVVSSLIEAATDASPSVTP